MSWGQRGCFGRDPNTQNHLESPARSNHHSRPAVTCAAALLLPMRRSVILSGTGQSFTYTAKVSC